MADTLVSGTSARKGVGVQLPPSAPNPANPLRDFFITKISNLP